MKKNNSYHCAIITEMTKEFQNLSRYSYLNFLFTLKNKQAKVMQFSKKTKKKQFHEVGAYETIHFNPRILGCNGIYIICT